MTYQEMCEFQTLYEAYLEAAKEQYHCYAMPIGSSAGESYPWGPSFVKLSGRRKNGKF